MESIGIARIQVSKEPTPLPKNGKDYLEDEFSPKSSPSILKPYIKVDQGSVWEQRNQQEINEKLEKVYTYYSLTRDLELNSPRVQKLQHIVDKMCADTKYLARVVIMNKGEKPNAFVCPDGTIFVTQSLLNRLDTEDEVAAVLGHEVGHLLFETHRYTSTALNDLEKLGIGFVHEKASDSKASLLLQKVGYNSFAFGSAIRKIQGSDRGSVHMSGLTRASLNVGEHFFLDSATAHQQEKPLDQMYHREIKKTNLEIIKEATGAEDFQPAQLKTIIEKLHPQDLDEVYRMFWEQRQNNYGFTKTLNELVMGRLMQAGYRQEDAILMLYTNPAADLAVHRTPEDCYLVGTPEKLNQLVAHLQNFENNKAALSEMFKLVFAKDIEPTLSATLSILQLVSQHLYNSERTPEEKGIAVTGASLIKLLESTDRIKLSDGRYQNNQERRTHFNSLALVKFLSKTYVDSAPAAILPKELEELESFLTLLKRSAISFNKKTIATNFFLKPGFQDPNGRKQAVCEAACRILEVEINEETFDFMDIDDFFNTYTESGTDDFSRSLNLAKMIKKMRQHFQNNNIEGEDRVKYIDYINAKINQIVFERSENFDLWESDESQALKSALMKFNLQTVLAMGLFESDDEEFYAYLEPAMSEFGKVMVQEGVDPQKLSKIQLINLCKNLFYNPDRYNDDLFLYGRRRENKVNTGEKYSGSVAKASIYDYDRFFKLPLIKIISGKEDVFNAATIEDLLNQTDWYFTALQFSGLKEGGNFNLLDDGILSLVVGRAIMRNFDIILDQGIEDAQLDDLYTFVSRFYPGGVEKDQLLRNINKRYLKSSEVTFESKLTYLYQYGEQVGYEGVAIVVDQIEDIATYRVFRDRLRTKLESYLQGNSTAAKVALVDNLSAQIVKNFKELLTTCESDPDSIKSVSTWCSRKWMEAVLGSYSSSSVNYDPVSEKFTLSGSGREVFRSVADTFTKLQSLSQAQRFAIAHKALFESGGAFASSENRQILANTLVSSLGIKQEFVQDLLYTGTLEADAEYIGFPAANMIGSLLFRAFDIKSVDLAEVRNVSFYTREQGHFNLAKVMTDEQILHNLRSITRDIVLYGAWARKDPRSRIAQMAEESDQLYYTISGKLNRLLEEEAEIVDESAARDYEIDPAIEAVIRGVESTGALGIRALQLATQFHNFSEPMNKRLSETFDANPGMSRLVFWENLHLRTQENPQVEQFMQRIKLGQYLGGGSLQTTYAATYTADNGETKEVIIKRKNPSVEGLLKRAYTTSRNVLETVSKKKGTKESANQAKTGLMLIDLAQQWCIDDLNDRFYEEHDDLFRQTVDKFNQEQGLERFYAPRRVFTELKVKSEELAKGRTVNKVLKDDTVPESTKKEIVQRLGQFFLYQLRGNSFMDEDGKRFFLIHSDPHIGNYMTDASPGEKLKIGVIDRSLYLKIDEKDVKVLEKLIGNSNPTDFVYSFINLVLDRNKDRGITRKVVTARVFIEIAKEYQKQFVKGKIDKFALLRTLLGELSKQGREAPLELRLMIRNISALQELMKKYGLLLQ
ncbi:MAG: M48 family metalloprotease [Candidatus Daviesbacteria bacterium]|nr:M48 family metalloprotease [Candidatus Daviesbacteria bacterium]